MAILTDAQRRILALLVARRCEARPGHAQDGLRLKDLADALGLAHPTVLAHLRRMQATGWVTSMTDGAAIRYAAPGAVATTWVDPGRGILSQWHAPSSPDWRFPLVDRVPDAAARRFLVEWLDRAEARAMLPKNVSRFEPAVDPIRMRIAVYGSRARGDVGAKADLDLLLVASDPWTGSRRLVDLAHEVGLDHPIPLDVQDVTEAGLEAMPEGFCDNLRREGKTVWMNDSLLPLVEAAPEPAHDP